MEHKKGKEGTRQFLNINAWYFIPITNNIV
jgi:hypothetical protein